MGFAEKEIGHMSLRKFMKLYEAYKLVFDTENMLSRNGQKYSELGKETSISDVIPF